MALTDNLVAFWKLEEASGTRNDSIGSNHLTDNNTVLSAAGKVGDAAQFVSGNAEYLSISSNSDVEMGDIDFTIAAWVYLGASSNYSIVTKDTDSPGSSRDYTLDYDPNAGKFRFYVNGSIIAVDTTVISTTTWYSILGWHDAAGNTVNISVNNGTPISTATGGAVPQVSSAEFRIGARQYAGNQDYLNGRADAVGLWKRVLTSDERTQLWNNGDGLEPPFPSVLPSGFRLNNLRPRIFAPGTSR